MSHGRTCRSGGAAMLAMALALVACVPGAWAQTPAAPAQEAKPSMTIYGFAMLDIGQNVTQIHPDWYDTMRVSKLPSSKDEYGKDNSTFAGVRQSRLGVKTSTPTALGELKTQFEFELFGTGVDSGQTTFRLRHAYGELGAFGAGQTWSPFMDPDVFPNSLEYWGPTGMVFFRNVQVRWMPLKGDSNLTLALERPGASGDAGVLADRIELQNIKGRTPLPDFTGAYAYGGSWGYLRVAGALRKINWDDMLADKYDLNGGTTGWGLNFSSNLKPSKKDVIRLQLVYGKGIENYMNDAPVDIGIVANPGNAATPILGKAIPILGTVTRWSRHTSTMSTWRATRTSTFQVCGCTSRASVPNVRK